MFIGLRGWSVRLPGGGRPPAYGTLVLLILPQKSKRQVKASCDQAAHCRQPEPISEAVRPMATPNSSIG